MASFKINSKLEYLFSIDQLMLTLFRKIRQSLLSENRFRKYLVYALGEILLVVIGILIALQINTWNENQQLQKTEQKYLLALKEEFNFNRTQLQKVLELNENNISNALKLANAMGPEKPKITEEEVGNLATWSLSREVQFNPSLGVLEELISSGQLGIITNQKLRFTLSSWKGLLDATKGQEQELHRLRYLTIDIVRNNFNLRKIIYGSWIEKTGIEPSKFKTNNLPLLKSLSFEGHIVGFVTMSINLKENEYKNLGQQIDLILSLIESDLTIEN